MNLKKIYILFIISLLFVSCKKKQQPEVIGYKENKSNPQIQETTIATEPLSNVKTYGSTNNHTLSLQENTLKQDANGFLLNNSDTMTLTIDNDVKTLTYGEIVNLINQNVLNKQLKDYILNETINFEFTTINNKSRQYTKCLDNTEETRKLGQYYKDNKRESEDNFYQRSIFAVKYLDRNEQTLSIGTFKTIEKDKDVDINWADTTFQNKNIQKLTNIKYINLSGITGLYSFEDFSNFKASGKMTLKQWKNEVISIDNKGADTLKDITAQAKVNTKDENGNIIKKDITIKPLDFTFDYVITCEDDIINIDVDLSKVIEDYYKVDKKHKLDKATYKLTLEPLHTSDNETFSEQPLLSNYIADLDDMIEENIATLSEITDETQTNNKENQSTNKENKENKEVKEETKTTEIKKGLINSNGNIQIYNNKGELIKNKLYTYNKNVYYLDNNGNAVKGWKEIQGNWYYFHSDGKQHSGFLNLNGKIFYLNPETKNSMQVQPITLNNEIYTFNADGSFATKTSVNNVNTNNQPTQNNKTQLNSLIKWVISDSKRTEIEVDPVIKNELSVLLENVPQHLIDKLLAEQVQIYICMEQNEANRNYMQKVNYKDKQSGDTEEELLPFKSSEKAIFIDGENIYNIYLGLGSWAAEQYKLQGKPVYQHSTWTTIQNNKKEELDDLKGLSDENVKFYRGNAKTSMASAIAFMMYNPAEFAVAGERNNKAYSFVNSFFKVTSSSGPGAK